MPTLPEVASGRNAAPSAERAGRHYHLVEGRKSLGCSATGTPNGKINWQPNSNCRRIKARFCAQQPQQLSADERAAIRQLAARDSGALVCCHHDPYSTLRRSFVNWSTASSVQVHGQSEQVTLTIEWTGGSMSQHQATRPVSKFEQLSYYPQLCERIRALAATGLNATEIANQLNQEGFHHPKHCTRFLLFMQSDIVKAQSFAPLEMEVFELTPANASARQIQVSFFTRIR